MNMCNKFTEEEINGMLELPRRDDLEEINNLKDKNETLEKEVNALKKWIRHNTGIEIEMDGLVEEMDGLFPEDEDKIMTPEESEYHIKKIEAYSDVFNYGRARVEEKMAESLL